MIRTRVLRSVLMLAVLVFGARCASDGPVQPVPFSHAIHAGKHAMPCIDCHPGARNGAVAGLPPLAVCLRCHMRPQGDPPSAAETSLRTLARSGAPVQWIQITRNPGHVYFSHRAHTSFAGMSCAECHGQVEQWTKPPRTPADHLVSMDACMDCHRENGASNECLICHR